jgi:hypothetical protein
MKNVNWATIYTPGMTSMALLGDYVYSTLSLLGSAFPQHVLVYNTVTEMWESVPDAWQDTEVVIQALRVTIYNGELRLFGINYTNHHVYLLYEGITDQTGVTNNVNDILETRGYGLTNDKGQRAGHDQWKRFQRMTLSLRTRHPSATVIALTDGYNEQSLIFPTPITKNVVLFYKASHPVFVSGDDPNEAKRQDYNTGSEALWPAPQLLANNLYGPIDMLPNVDSQMPGGPKQEALQRNIMRVMGRWCSIRISNTQGCCDILGVSVDVEEKRSDLLTLA